MMKKLLTLLFVLILISSVNAQTIYIDSTETFSPYVFGHNIEHCRSTLFNGLSAQLLRNRKFAGKPSKNEGIALQWFGIGDKVFYMLNETETYTKHLCQFNMVNKIGELCRQIIANLVPGQTAGIGQREIYLKANTTYLFRTVSKVNTDVNLTVSLTNRSGDKVYVSHNFLLKPSEEWALNEFEMTSTVRDTDACIRYTFKERAELAFGALSMLPKDNFHGMRKDVIENLKTIHPRIIRWPGGNFSGEYRWKDGILPSDMRGALCAYQQVEASHHSYGYDFHEIGTDEFIALCREVGAEPFITINLAWSNPKESAEWVEYCNGPVDSEYGKIRAENGHPEPYNVKFWSLGNEMGFDHMEGPRGPANYAKLASTHAESMLKVTPDLNFFSSGPYPSDNWAENSAKVLSDKAKYVSLHQYTCPGKSWGEAAYHYTTDEDIRKTYESIASHTMNFLERARAMRSCLDRKASKDLMISFDEWNQWYTWYRPSSVAEGIYAIRTLHMFIAESNNLNMPVVCYFQPISEGAIVISPESSRLTANGQMFAILKEHQDGKICKIADNEDYSTMATLKSDTLTITMVNYEYEKERTFNFSLKGNILQSDLYSSDDVTPHSYFNKSELNCSTTKKNISMTLPAHSAAIIKMKIKK